MSFSQGDRSDYDQYVHFTESQGADPNDESIQEAYFTFIFEYGGDAKESDPDSIEALFDFLDAYGFEYDEADIYERYVTAE